MMADAPRMQGKTCVITGATSGIGRAAAEQLAQMGARIVVVARSRTRGEATIDRLRAIAPELKHAVHYADLSHLAEVKAVGAQIAAENPCIDVLINNAGTVFSARHVTVDGLEETFAVNHVAAFILTLALRDSLFAAAPARVITVSSTMHRRAALDFSDLQFTRGYSGVTAYERSKLCNILFTRELARRWAGGGVTANALHPGLVATRMANRSGGLITPAFRVIKALFGLSPQHGAQTSVYLASSPDVAGITGGYFERCRQVPPSRNAENDEDAGRLWAETAKITEIDDAAPSQQNAQIFSAMADRR